MKNKVNFKVKDHSGIEELERLEYRIKLEAFIEDNLYIPEGEELDFVLVIKGKIKVILGKKNMP